MGLATTQCVDDFDPIAIGEAMLAVAAARDDFAIDLDRDAALGQAFESEQLQHAECGVDLARAAIEQYFHVRIVSPCRGRSQPRTRVRRAGRAPFVALRLVRRIGAWFDAVHPLAYACRRANKKTRSKT